MFKLRSILQVDFLNLRIYVQTQKYTESRFSKLMYFFSNLEVYFKGAEATCVKISTEIKKCFLLKDMLNFNVF